MNRSSFPQLADTLVPATATGRLTADTLIVLATPLIATVATVAAAGEAVGVVGAVAGTVGAATAVGGLATAAVQVAAKGDEEEPAAPPEGAVGAGGHVSTLLAHRTGRR